MTYRRLLTVVVCLAVLVAAAADLAGGAPKPMPPSAATLNVAPESGLAGSPATASGSLFGKLEMVNLYFDGALVNSVKTDRYRRFSTTFFVPPGAPGGVHTVSAVGQSSRKSATDTFDVSRGVPSLTLNPSPGGLPGVLLTATGSGFAVGETVNVSFAGAYMDAAPTNVSGGFSLQFLVPMAAASGPQPVTALGQNSGRLATATFVVSGTAGLLLDPGTGAPGSATTVSGSNFAVGETVAVTVGGTAAGTPTANGSGAFTLPVTVPAGASPGPLQVAGTGQSSSRTASAAFTVSGPASLSANPVAGLAGSAVQLSGAGFGAGESVDISFDALYLGAAAANASGAFVNLAFTIPAGAAAGPHTLKGEGASSNRTAQAGFAVTPGPGTTPGITLDPAKGPPTSQVTVRGAHFGPYETVQLRLDAVTVAFSSTDELGDFSQGFQVSRETTPGAKTVTATGLSSGRSAEAQFKVQTDWARFRFDNRNSGYNPFENVLNKYNVAGLVEAWTATTGGAVNSSPTVANGVVYVGCEDGQLYAFDAATGLKPDGWTNPTTGNEIHSGPTVADGVVYVNSLAGTTYAFDAGTGDKLWEADSGGTYSSPTVANGKVYVVSGDRKALVAYNTADGAELWSSTPAIFLAGTPALADGLVYANLIIDGKIYPYNADTGAWSDPPIAVSAQLGNASPAVVNGIVYFGTSGFHAFNAATGAKLWSGAEGGRSSPAVASGVVYVGGRDGKLHAYEADTGTTPAGWTDPTIGDYISSSPAVANGVVYVGSDDSKLYAFDAASGKELWTATTGSYVFSSPAVADGMVFVGSEDGKLRAYKLPISSPPGGGSIL